MHVPYTTLVMEDNKLTQMRENHDFHEWWWCFDDSLSRILYLLNAKGYVVIDKFLPEGDANKVATEVANLYRNGHLSKEGIVGGGRLGKDEFEIDKKIRSDILGYFDGNENCFDDKIVVPLLISKMNTLLCEMRDLAPEKCSDSKGANVVYQDLKDVSTRSKAMVTCYGYDHDGLHARTRYAWHIDNPIRNGRRVTCIFYTNKEWTKSRGGYLDVFPPGGETASVAPLFNRLVLFWSDERCPHEVTPCDSLRFALSVWFIDKTEKLQAVVDSQIVLTESSVENEPENGTEDTESLINQTMPVPTTPSLGAFDDIDIAPSDNNSVSIFMANYDPKLAPMPIAAPIPVSVPFSINLNCEDAAHLAVTVMFSQLGLSREQVLSFVVDAFEHEIRVSPPLSVFSHASATAMTVTTIPLPCAIERSSVQAVYIKKEGNLRLKCQLKKKTIKP